MFFCEDNDAGFFADVILNEISNHRCVNYRDFYNTFDAILFQFYRDESRTFPRDHLDVFWGHNAHILLLSQQSLSLIDGKSQ